MSTKITTKLCLLSFSLYALNPTTALANVKGMSANELASFATNAQTPNGYHHLQPQKNQIQSQTKKGLTANQLPNGNIELTPDDQRYILSQLSNLVEQQQASAQPRGFTTVSLAPRNQSAPKAETTKPLNQKTDTTEQPQENPQAPKDTQTQTSAVTSNSNDGDWMMGAVKQIGAVQRQGRIQQAQTQPKAQAEPQRRSIQAGQFGSTQVHYASYQPNNVAQDYQIIRPTLSSAPTIKNTQFYSRGPATIGCVVEAAKKHNVPPHVLLGIASKERGQNGQTVKNSNATYDLGHFQLNTIHFKPGQAFGHIHLEDAKWRGCFNAELAAWHLNRQLTMKSKQHEDFWTKAGGYHSWTPKYNRIYVYGTPKNKGLIHYAQEWQQWLKRNPNMNF